MRFDEADSVIVVRMWVSAMTWGNFLGLWVNCHDLVCRVTERGMVVCTSLPVSEQMGNMDEAALDVNSTLQ